MIKFPKLVSPIILNLKSDASSDPAALGAGCSAIAVHVASDALRWFRAVSAAGFPLVRAVIMP